MSFVQHIVFLCLVHCAKRILSQSEECSATYTSESGIITSPNYPLPYPHNQNCVYVIRQPVGNRIKLKFIDFQLEGGDNCINDFVQIRDGGSVNSSLLYQACGTYLPNEVKSTQNMLWILFHSDASLSTRGFNATYAKESLQTDFVLMIRNDRIILLAVEDDRDTFIDIPVTNMKQPSSVDYDPVTDCILWIDLSRNEINCAFPNGTGFMTLLSIDINGIFVEFAVDSESRLLFFTVAGYDVIGVMSLDSWNYKFIIYIGVNMSVSIPGSIVVDVANRQLFWTVIGDNTRIEQANYDGSNRIVLVSNSLVFPIALAFDTNKNRLYWSDYFLDILGWYDFNSGLSFSVPIPTGHSYVSLAPFRGFLLITDWTFYGLIVDESYLRVLNPDTGYSTIIYSFDGFVTDIHTYPNETTQNSVNSCSSSNDCNYMCVPLPGNQKTCLCPDGQTWNASRKMCIQVTNPCAINNGGCSHKCILMTNGNRRCVCPAGLFLDMNFMTCISVCGGNISSYQGLIQSPNYPRNYSDNLTCIYIISQPEGYRIDLQFKFFQLEDEKRCLYDYVEIRDGDTESSPLIRQRLCGDQNPTIHRTTKNKMRILFKTDSSISLKGFSAVFTRRLVPRETILMTLGSKIVSLDKETESYIQIHLNNVYDIQSIGYDTINDRVYWTGEGQSEIFSAFINGSDVVSTFDLGIGSLPMGLAVDQFSKLIFYTDAERGLIGLVSMRSAQHKYLISTDLDVPYAIALDSMNGTMYWTDWGGNAKIERATYDGNDRKALVQGNLFLPHSLVIDTRNNRLYWLDIGMDTIEWTTLDGKQRSEIYVPVNTLFVGLAVYEDIIYLTNWDKVSNESYLHVMNNNGRELKKIGYTQGRLNDIHIYSEIYKQDENGCAKNYGNCSAICIPLPNKSSKCTCPDGQDWNGQQRACVESTSACTDNNGGCSHICIPLTNNGRKCLCPMGMVLNNDLTSCVQLCGGNYTEHQGVIQSPSYPSFAPDDVECIFVINQPEGYRITFTFTDFMLEEEEGCMIDFVEIRDGDSPTSPLLALESCHSEIPLPQRTTQNSMWIRFKSESFMSFSRFHATYIADTMPLEFLLISTEDGIIRMDIETRSDIVLPITNLTSPEALAYDPEEDHVYWVESTGKEIRRAFLNGSDNTRVINLGTNSIIERLAIDSYKRILFYTDSGTQQIGSVNLTGFVKNVLITILDKPLAIALDVMQGVVYWTSFGKVQKIERAQYNGSDYRMVATGMNSFPIALALDAKNKRLYWVDSFSGQIEWTNLEGTIPTRIVSTLKSFVTNLALYKTHLYVTSWDISEWLLTENYLSRIDTNGNNLTTLAKFNEVPNNMIIYSELTDPYRQYTLSAFITASKPFYTNGSFSLDLACQSFNSQELKYTWRGVSCVRQRGNTCSIVPNPPQDDGKNVTCIVTNQYGQRGIATFNIVLHYPPTLPPEIGIPTHDLLEGASAQLVCSVRGGKPLVNAIKFSCGSRPADTRTDFAGENAVQSIIVFNRLSSSDNGVVCVCEAVWNNTNWYTLKASRTLILNGTAPIQDAQGSSVNAGAVVGGVIGAIILVTIIVIIIIVVRRKGMPFGRNTQHLREEPDNMSFSSAHGGRTQTSTAYDNPDCMDTTRQPYGHSASEI